MNERLKGRCPSCYAESLFVGHNGYITCSVIGCKDPGAAHDLLDTVTPSLTIAQHLAAAQQDWVLRLTIMQQSVLMSGIRGPDGIRKDHPVKVFMRWYRRCVLLSAFDRVALSSPISRGGGSFTGPLPHNCGVEPHYDERWGDDYNQRAFGEYQQRAELDALTGAKDAVFRSVDELPHHFWLHLVHCSEILGYKHPDEKIRAYWHDFYNRACEDMHMWPETEEQMDLRLSDNETAWRAREATPAR